MIYFLGDLPLFDTQILIFFSLQFVFMIQLAAELRIRSFT